MNQVTTNAIKDAEATLDEFGYEVFPSYHGITDDGEYSLYTIVTREFDVMELMTMLGIDVDPVYEFRPAPSLCFRERQDVEAAAAIASGVEYWNNPNLDDVMAQLPADEFDRETVENALNILQDSSGVGDLILEYFNLAEVSETNAVAQLSRYAELLHLTDNAYREAGWEI